MLYRSPLRKVLLAVTLLLLAACGAPAQPSVRASLEVAAALGGPAAAGFTRAEAPRAFTFPADHGPHPDFAVEWWYYTGNLETADGRRFGFQLTFFRSGLRADPPARESAWAAANVYMAHFALSDIQGERFYAFERFSRDAAGLAGASAAPFRVFLDDWQAAGALDDPATMHLRAAQSDLAIDLRADATQPPVLQGDRGLSQKGPEPGNASYYYSLPRMPTTGTISVGGERLTVRGLSWMDREWSTSALSEGVVGWDWFALQLDDGSNLMFYRLRRADGSSTPFSAGSLASPSGATRRLAADQVTITALGSWRSPRSGVTYPSGWRLQAPALGLDVTIEPYLRDQELPTTVVYWEGAVQVRGTHNGTSISGSGYVELAGYADGAGAP